MRWLALVQTGKDGEQLEQAKVTHFTMDVRRGQEWERCKSSMTETLSSSSRQIQDKINTISAFNQHLFSQNEGVQWTYNIQRCSQG